MTCSEKDFFEVGLDFSGGVSSFFSMLLSKSLAKIALSFNFRVLWRCRVNLRVEFLLLNLLLFGFIKTEVFLLSLFSFLASFFFSLSSSFSWSLF